MVRRSVLTFFGIVIAASALSLASLSAQAADAPITGTWELNLAASSSTLPLPASQTRTYVSTGQQEKMTGTGVDAKGNAINVSFDVPCSSER